MGSPSPVRLWKKYGLTISGPTMEEIWAHHLRSDYGRNMGSPSPVRLYRLSLVIVCYFLEPKAKKKFFLLAKIFLAAVCPLYATACYFAWHRQQSPVCNPSSLGIRVLSILWKLVEGSTCQTIVLFPKCFETVVQFELQQCH